MLLTFTALAVAAFVVFPRSSLVAQEPGLDGQVPVRAPHAEAGRGLPGAAAVKDIVSLKERHPGLSTQLGRVADLHAGIGRGSQDGEPPAFLGNASADRGLDVDQNGDAQVYIETESDTDVVADAVRTAGYAVETVNSDEGIVQARVPVAALDAVAAMPGVRLVREPDYGQVQAGSVLTEGDAILNGPALRSAFGVDGTGVRVGVISDGLEGLAAAQASGDLPAVNSTTCDMIETAGAGDPANPTDPGAGAEGTAMLEIVHDIAPGAELWYGFFGGFGAGTSLDFTDAVDCLAANVDIVIDDIAFLNAGPYDGTSVVSTNASTELNRTTNRIRGYYNAVGNSARNHYQETFLSSGYTIEGGATDWTIHRYQSTASTVDAGFGYQCDTSPLQGFCGDTVALMAGGTLSVYLQWNDPWGASANDYDLFLVDESPAPDDLLLASANTQNGNDNPAEGFSWQNTTGADQFVDVVIARFGAGSARTFDMFVQCSGCYVLNAANNFHNFNTESSSVGNNSDAGGGVVSLGAIDRGDPGNDLIEWFSSRGPTNSGASKPDASAIDGVSITGAGGFPTPFYGTSATGPHAGAIAALVLSCKPSLLAGEAGDVPATDRTSLRNALLNSATDLGAAGVDNTYGRGRLNANAAAVAAGCTTDGDADGILNAADNCPTIANAPQANTDSDPLVTPGIAASDVTRPNTDKPGNACDLDDDNDGIPDVQEPAGCNGSGALNALDIDSDGDRAADGAECFLGSNPGDPNSRPVVLYPSNLDADHDGLTTAQETARGTNPNDIDTDDDGLSDGLEVRAYNTSPTNANTDGDGCDDAAEIASINADSKVDSIDMQLVAQRFGTLNLPNVDINKDRVVSSIDLQLIAQNFNALNCAT
jgi:hypothetical protein